LEGHPPIFNKFIKRRQEDGIEKYQENRKNGKERRVK